MSECWSSHSSSPSLPHSFAHSRPRGYNSGQSSCWTWGAGERSRRTLNSGCYQHIDGAWGVRPKRTNELKKSPTEWVLGLRWSGVGERSWNSRERGGTASGASQEKKALLKRGRDRSSLPRSHKLTFLQLQYTVCSVFLPSMQKGRLVVLFFRWRKQGRGIYPKPLITFMEEPESQLLPFEFPGRCLATKPPCLFHCTVTEQALNNHNWWCWLKGRAQSESGEFVFTYQWILFFLWSITYTHLF